MLPDEADIWSVLVSSLSAGDDGSDGGQGDDLALDTTVVDLVDHFAVIDDPRHPSWVVHPLAAVLTRTNSTGSSRTRHDAAAITTGL
ncbi:hypothetical protein [Acrocarpospora sp. B8E8]|uniref:hypothetical protein n=1 Tax=Acrocarpospora sp. B8E8 TaxID=3153572 RepID=UPI00325DF824